jgi:hypothetical protein
LVRRSRSAVGRYLGCAVFPWRTSAINDQIDAPNPLFEFASLQSFAQRTLADRRSDRLLSWTLAPFSTSGSGSSQFAGFPDPASFRLQGLATLLTVSTFRARAGSVSPRRRSWDFTLRSLVLPRGIRRVSARMNPHAVYPAGIAIAEAMTRSGGPRLLGFDPHGSSARPGMCLARRIVGCSPGFRPFQGIPMTALTGIPPSLLSRAFQVRRSGPNGASKYQSALTWSRPPRPASRRGWVETALLGFPHLSVPEHSGERPPGPCVHLVLCRALLPTTQQSLGDPTPCRSCSGSAAVPIPTATGCLLSGSR